MKKLKIGLVSLFSVFALGAAFVPTQAAFAADCPLGTPPAKCIQTGVNNAGGDTSENRGDMVGERIKTIVNILLYILGAIAVVMIVIGGVRYTTSGGDSSGVSGAKNTILYAVVGLVVAIMAYAIVNFVLDAFIK